MDAKTLDALKGSIAKWESIVAGTGEDRLAANCPLCQLFSHSCTGCPVAEKTCLSGCEGSPWSLWDDVVSFNKPRQANTPKRVELAQAELDFLRSLLPGGA